MKDKVSKDSPTLSCNTYDAYKINVSLKHLRLMALLAALINLFMIIPDMVLIQTVPGKIFVFLIRLLFSLLLIPISFILMNVKKYLYFCLIISLCEIIAVMIFLSVICQYFEPNLLIQTMGLITLILLVFFIPNKWEFSLFISLMGMFGFFLCVHFFITSFSGQELGASFTYTSVALLINVFSAKNNEDHQYLEFDAKNKLEHISSTDYLTQTANRFKMKEEADRWIDFCKRQSFPLSLVFLDVDNLKTINDQNGHMTGDSVLAKLAQLIGEQLHNSDLLARWGGDEFVMLLPNTNLQKAVTITENIRNCVETNDYMKSFHMSCSFGVVEMDGNSNFESMVYQADQLMYVSKEQGKNTIRWKQFQAN